MKGGRRRLNRKQKKKEAGGAGLEVKSDAAATATAAAWSTRRICGKEMYGKGKNLGREVGLAGNF